MFGHSFLHVMSLAADVYVCTISISVSVKVHALLVSCHVLAQRSIPNVCECVSEKKRQQIRIFFHVLALYQFFLTFQSQSESRAWKFPIHSTHFSNICYPISIPGNKLNPVLFMLYTSSYLP